MKEKEEQEIKIKEILEKYNVDLGKLEREQEKLAKNLEIKDSIDFSFAERIAGIDNVFFKNQIIYAIVVISSTFEVLEQEYFQDKIRFPYLQGFRAYRELPSMMSAFNNLDEKPDLVFVRGHGILHPRNLGIASHFSLSAGVPAIGIADSLLVGEVDKENIFIDGKLVGKVIFSKKGANPVYVSPGDKISITTSAELTKKFTKEPYKLPEPLRLARKYAKEIRKEIFMI